MTNPKRDDLEEAIAIINHYAIEATKLSKNPNFTDQHRRDCAREAKLFKFILRFLKRGMK